MDSEITAVQVAAAVRRYLDGESSVDDLRATLAACDAALRAGAADPGLSGPVGAALLTIMEQDEGVRPPADVRSALAAVERALTPAPPARATGPRAPIPRPRTKRRRRGR